MQKKPSIVLKCPYLSWAAISLKPFFDIYIVKKPCRDKSVWFVLNPNRVQTAAKLLPSSSKVSADISAQSRSEECSPQAHQRPHPHPSPGTSPNTRPWALPIGKMIEAVRRKGGIETPLKKGSKKLSAEHAENRPGRPGREYVLSLTDNKVPVISILGG